jgi:hypothetical protein
MLLSVSWSQAKAYLAHRFGYGLNIVEQLKAGLVVGCSASFLSFLILSLTAFFCAPVGRGSVRVFGAALVLEVVVVHRIPVPGREIVLRVPLGPIPKVSPLNGDTESEALFLPRFQ